MSKSLGLILSAARTPIGSFNGALASVSATDLGAVATRAAIERAGIQASDVKEVYYGNVIGAGLGQAPSQQVVAKSGLTFNTPCTSINKVCSSGLKSVMLASSSIALGQQDCLVAGGFENMSSAPYYLDKARSGYRLGHGKVMDSLILDGLWDPHEDCHMGSFAERCAVSEGITREEQDAYALESYRRAAAAWEGKKFNEVVPVEVPSRRGDPTIVSVDQEFTNIKVEKVAGLRSAFQKGGSVTAANASTINDGGAALVIASEEFVQRNGSSKPLARIIGFADAAREPHEFTIAPADAIPKALAHAGITADDVDFYEINEAFSVVALANMRRLGLDPEKVNVYGGAVALGHPIGASGARILTTLLSVLENEGGKYGVAAICNGGGGASAVVVERL